MDMNYPREVRRESMMDLRADMGTEFVLSEGKYGGTPSFRQSKCHPYVSSETGFASVQYSPSNPMLAYSPPTHGLCPHVLILVVLIQVLVDTILFLKFF